MEHRIQRPATSVTVEAVIQQLLPSGELNRPLTPILLKSIAIHLPFLSRYFCKNMPLSWQKVVYTPPICITIRLPFVSRYFCRSIRVRGRWDAPNPSRCLPLFSRWFSCKEGGRIYIKSLLVAGGRHLGQPQMKTLGTSQCRRIEDRSRIISTSVFTQGSALQP